MFYKSGDLCKIFQSRVSHTSLNLLSTLLDTMSTCAYVLRDSFPFYVFHNDSLYKHSYKALLGHLLFAFPSTCAIFLYFKFMPVGL